MTSRPSAVRATSTREIKPSRVRPSCLVEWDGADQRDASILWELRCIEASCAHDIEALLDTTSALSIPEWLAIGATVAAESQERLSARRRLEMLLAQSDLAVTAWFVRDLTATCSWCTRRPDLRVSGRDRRRLAAARDAAAWSALALLARARLSSEDFDALYRPFATVAPLTGPSRGEHRRAQAPGA